MNLTADGKPFLLMALNWVDGLVAASHAVRKPNKLASFHKAWNATNG